MFLRKGLQMKYISGKESPLGVRAEEDGAVACKAIGFGTESHEEPIT